MRAQRAVHTEHLERLLAAAVVIHNVGNGFDELTELRRALEPFGHSQCATCRYIVPAKNLVRACLTDEYTGRTWAGDVCPTCFDAGISAGGDQPLRIEPIAGRMERTG